MADYFENDHFNRIEDAELIERFLTKRVQEKKFGNVVGTYVLNLDSAWGTGKTYFLEGLAKYLQSPDGGDHIAIIIDAWKDDYSDDPLPYITSSIHTEIKEKLGSSVEIPSRKLAECLGNIAIAGAKGGVSQIVKKMVGEEAVSQILEEGTKAFLDQSGNAMISSVNAQKDAVNEFQDALREISVKVDRNEDTRGPIFVLVDELDRCRPDYAIRFLERIKHFFAVEGFVFIISTDTKQLTSAVKGAYGAEFDGERYLQRFFDRTYHFSKPNMIDFVKAHFFRTGLSAQQFDCLPDFKPSEFVGNIFTQSGINLREAQQILDILETCTTIWEKEIPLNIVCLLPKIADYYFKPEIDKISGKEVRNHNFLDSKFENQDYRPAGAAFTYKSIALSSIVSRFLQPIDPHGERATDEIGQWVQDLMTKEYVKFRDPSGRGGKVRSLVLTYDELIRKVGHIEKQKE